MSLMDDIRRKIEVFLNTLEQARFRGTSLRNTRVDGIVLALLEVLWENTQRYTSTS